VTRIVADITDPEAKAPAVVDESIEGGKLPERAIQNEDGSITLPLIRAVTVAVRSASAKVTETVYAELTFHELLGVDMRAVMNAPKETQVDTLLARSLKVSVPVAKAIFDQLKKKDAEDAVSIASFL
jgi:hypothetical protein